MNENLSIVVIGLGSMGKRRIRNLRANGVRNIIGYDLRDDRRKEAHHLYQINPIANLDQLMKLDKQDAWIVSVPPDVHHVYMKIAVQSGIPCFVEASVVDTGFEEIMKDLDKKGLLLAPSSTLYFHPAVKKIFEVVRGNGLGRISNIIYHSGQYLPDWHTYEKVSEYYVSNKLTGGAREIVPFELTWLTKLFGFPKRVTGFYKKTIFIEGAEDIDDTYNALFEYHDFLMNLSVDVVSRFATRKLTINGERGQLTWDWNDQFIRMFNPDSQEWQTVSYEATSAASGYNKNITEQMYIEEIAAFLNAVKHNGTFPNTIGDDHRVLQLLYNVERSSDTNQIQVCQ